MSKLPKVAVGYGKPPVATQFKPGQSGNPKGRPKGQPKLEDMILSELASTIKVKEGEVVTAKTKKQVIVHAVTRLAMQGNLQAVRLLFDILSQVELATDKPPEEVSTYDIETLKYLLSMRAED